MSIEEKLQEIVSRYLQPAYEHGYSVSVELDGQSLLKHYSGNVKINNIYYPVNVNTAFDVGSLAKQFAACCIAILACEKCLNLEDSVRVYLPEMKEYAEKITIRHCISMTSGVRQIYCLKHMQSSSLLGEIELFYKQEQPFNDVGNFTGYSNACYTLLGHIVEKVTGGINQFAKRRIFDPLGMANTQGYGVMGDGGLYSTADDLVLWHNCLMNRYLPGAPDGLFDLLFSPFTLNNGELCPYGFGFFYDEEDRDNIWQFGDMTIWQCIMRVLLKNKLSIIVLTYHRDYEPVELALDLENTIIKELFDMPPRNNYKSAYFNKPKHISKIRKIKHPKFPNAQKQNPLTEDNFDKYLGRYYSLEMDTYFDIIPDSHYFQIKYVNEYGDGYTNLFDYSDENNIKMHTCGDWGRDWLPIEFYGNKEKIDFFVLQEGIGYFYFDRCTL